MTKRKIQNNDKAHDETPASVFVILILTFVTNIICY